MNLNRKQFLAAVERGRALLKELKADYPELKLYPVFSRFGPRSGQCGVTTDLRKIVLDFPDMLAEENGRKKAQKSQRWNVISERVQEDESVGHQRAQKATKRLRGLLLEIKAAEKNGDTKTPSSLRDQADKIERGLLNPDLKLYCGDVLIEYRLGAVKYESLRRLQQDPRLPQALNVVGNVRVVAGSLEALAGEL